MTPLFDRYGEWPEGPIAVPDPNAPVNVHAMCITVAHHTGVGTTLVLSANDKLEIEREELGL